MARIEVLYGTVPVRTIELDIDRLVVGRGPDAALRLNDELVSREHCAIVLDDDGHVVKDLESSSGTIVAGRKVGDRRLRHGDHIAVGKHTLRYYEPAKETPWGHVGGRARRRGETVESAAVFAHLQGVASRMSDMAMTRPSSTAELGEMRRTLVERQRPRVVWTEGERHCSFVFDDETRRFEAGLGRGWDARLPGFSFGSKEQFAVRMHGRDAELDVADGADVEVRGRKVQGCRVLRAGDVIECRGRRFKFVQGSRETPATR